MKYLVSLSNISNEQIVQWASEFGHLTIIKYFVNTHKASVTANDNYAIYIAGENEHISVVKFLIRKGADIKKIRNPKTLSRIIGWLMITKHRPNMNLTFSASELLSAKTNFQIKSGQFKTVLLLEKNPKNSEAFAYSAIESIEKFNMTNHIFNKFTVLRKDLIKIVPTIKSELLKTIYNIKPVSSVTSLQHKDKRFISGTIVSKHNFKEGVKYSKNKKNPGLNQITDINTELKTNLLDIAKTMGLIETQMEQLHFMSFDIKTQKKILSIWVNSIM